MNPRREAATILCAARSFLFVPGDRPERVARALSSDADAVIVDLEDAVRADRRGDARSVVRALAGRPPASPALVVRVNTHGTAMFADDVAAALDGCAAAVMIPKFVPGPHADLAMRALAEIESAWDLGAPTPVIGLIESAAGVLALAQPFTLPDGVVRLAFGAADYYADLGLPYQSSGTHTELAMATLVLACAAAGLPSPVASPHFSPGDHTGLVSVSKHARGLGFGGGLCIHPDQIGAVNALFRISNDERSWAHRVIDAWEDPASRTKGAITVDGALVDEAMVRHARSIL